MSKSDNKTPNAAPGQQRKLPDLTLIDGENPEWTKEMFARAKPLGEFPQFAYLMKHTGKRKPGRF